MKCVYCGTEEGVVKQSKGRLACRPCNRDQTFYYNWRRRVRNGGIAVAAHEIENLRRRMELIQLAARAEIGGTHVRWVAGNGTKGRHPGGLDPIEPGQPGTIGKTHGSKVKLKELERG